ncbi:xylosyltransferase oxt-like [Mytilus trossulus]|uniref:xylosyltransferase oxt-like n=1 Tax=Mytilus trossulus TaxID=6551 RepID=UPI003005CBB6
MNTYIGCFQDGPTRLFPVGPYTKWNNEMSTSICFDYCSSKNYKYFATEYGSQCFCGNGEKLNSSQYPYKKKTDCNMACIGNAKQICGGNWRASVYRINHNGQNGSTTYHTPTSQKQITSDKGTCEYYVIIFINE